MSKLWIRKIETTVTSFEMVTTFSSDAMYVEKDKRGCSVASVAVKPERVTELWSWREATDVEAAIYNEGQGIDNDS